MNREGVVRLPKFYLNVINTADASDKEAFDLASLEEAKIQAIAGARDLISDNIRAGLPVYESHRIEITDDDGVFLHTVRFSDIIDLRP